MRFISKDELNFKRNSSGRTRIYEYTPPPKKKINALVSPLITETAALPIELSSQQGLVVNFIQFNSFANFGKAIFFVSNNISPQRFEILLLLKGSFREFRFLSGFAKIKNWSIMQIVYCG